MDDGAQEGDELVGGGGVEAAGLQQMPVDGDAEDDRADQGGAQVSVGSGIALASWAR